MFGISLRVIFGLMIINSVLCLTVAHVSSHGSQAAFSCLVLAQTIGKYVVFSWECAYVCGLKIIRILRHVSKADFKAKCT